MKILNVRYEMVVEGNSMGMGTIRNEKNQSQTVRRKKVRISLRTGVPNLGCMYPPWYICIEYIEKIK